MGKSINEISDWLYPGTRIERWSRETISKLLKNEKYTGDVILQKIFVSNVFESKNVGQMDMYIIHEHHPTIINKEIYPLANK